jgi:hypothetical protein
MDSSDVLQCAVRNLIKISLVEKSGKIRKGHDICLKLINQSINQSIDRSIDRKVTPAMAALKLLRPLEKV